MTVQIRQEGRVVVPTCCLRHPETSSDKAERRQGGCMEDRRPLKRESGIGEENETDFGSEQKAKGASCPMQF